TVMTPLGLTRKVTTTRAVTLQAASGNAATLTETVSVNGGPARTIVEDVLAHTITMTSPMGRKVVLTIDDRERPQRMTIPGINPVEWHYDNQGHIHQITTDNLAVTTEYDPTNGYAQSTTDPMHQVTKFGTDAVGRITSVVLPNQNLVGFGYDLDGNLNSV